jgi:lipopolysaccharide exporter
VEDRALRGVPWTLLSYAGSRGITFVVTIVLARLLVPGDFGILALAVLVMGFLNLFRDLGLGSALVLRQDLDERAKGTVLTLLVATGAAMTALVAAASPLAALAFDTPRLTGVLALLSLTLVLGSVSWFYEMVMQRELEFRRRFYGQMAMAFSYAAVSLPLAAGGAGVWSLVVGQLAASAGYAAAAAWLAPYRVRPAFERRAAADVFATGRGFLAQGGLAFVRQNVDYFAVGRILGPTQLGFYSMAYRLSELPYLAVADPIAKVTFPAFARMRHRGEAIGPSFLSTLQLVALVTCPVGVTLSAVATPFTSTVFGQKWLPMAGALSILGVWAAIRTVEVTIAWLLNSVGQASLMAILSAVVLVPLVPALLLAAEAGGIGWVAWVVLGDIVLSIVLLSIFAERRAGVSVSEQWLAVRPVALACPLAWVAGRLAAGALDAVPDGLALAGGVASAFSAYVLALRLLDRALLTRSAVVFRTILARGPQTAAG